MSIRQASRGAGGQRAFVEAAERLLYGKKVPAERNPIGKGIRQTLTDIRFTGGGPRTRPAMVNKLKQVARRSPEAMLKIVSTASSAGKVLASLKYISRRGELELEDQDGDRLTGKHAPSDVFDSWQDRDPIPDGEPIAVTEGALGRQARVSGRRESFHLVLSMPAGTPHAQLRQAVREFASETFLGHQYAMAFHTPDTDPDPVPSPHPHVHLTVKAVGKNRKRLNPRKADLRVWRERFAEKLVANGIDAVATSRSVRGQRQPGLSQANRQMQGRGALRTRPGRQVPRGQAVARNRATARSVLADWQTVIGTLSRSPQATERQLAKDLAARLDVESMARGGGGAGEDRHPASTRVRGSDEEPRR